MIRMILTAAALATAVYSAADARTRTNAPVPVREMDTKRWAVSEDQRIEDLNFLVDQLKAKYAYRDTRKIDIDQIKTLYRDDAVKATNARAWLGVVENVVAELYDHHATLGWNNDQSPRLVPSGTDIWAEILQGRPTITQVRAGSVAARAGLRAGMTIEAIGGRAVDQIIDDHVPRSMALPDPEAGSYVLRVMLAGTQAAKRSVKACTAPGRCKVYSFGPAATPRVAQLVTFRKLRGDIGVIQIENSLGDSDTVQEFDRALDALKGCRGLILDLRNTPSGGDTDVAEPILARFMTAPGGYQRTFEPAPGRNPRTDSWVKDLDPREPTVTQPLVVLVDHWTGSMGEGMAIGFDGLKRGTVVGTHMAGLLGGTGQIKLPHTDVPVNFPIERLYHVNGLPREQFVPPVLVNMSEASGSDPILDAGMNVLVEKIAEPN